ncbi:hypothetical protein HOD08_00645 [bacterium]|nr:hypothetical protein [bacterium]
MKIYKIALAATLLLFNNNLACNIKEARKITSVSMADTERLIAADQSYKDNKRIKEISGTLAQRKGSLGDVPLEMLGVIEEYCFKQVCKYIIRPEFPVELLETIDALLETTHRSGTTRSLCGKGEVFDSDYISSVQELCDQVHVTLQFKMKTLEKLYAPVEIALKKLH